MMKDMGIKEIARQVSKVANTRLMGREGCVDFTDREIVLCIKDEPGHFTTGITFSIDTPWMILTAATNLINRMVSDLSPTQAAEIVTSTVPKATVHQRKKQPFMSVQ